MILPLKALDNNNWKLSKFVTPFLNTIEKRPLFLSEYLWCTIPFVQRADKTLSSGENVFVGVHFVHWIAIYIRITICCAATDFVNLDESHFTNRQTGSGFKIISYNLYKCILLRYLFGSRSGRQIV